MCLSENIEVEEEIDNNGFSFCDAILQFERTAGQILDQSTDNYFDISNKSQNANHPISRKSSSFLDYQGPLVDIQKAGVMYKDDLQTYDMFV